MHGYKSTWTDMSSNSKMYAKINSYSYTSQQKHINHDSKEVYQKEKVF